MDFPIRKPKGYPEREGRLEEIPWDLIVLHRAQAWRNHARSLEMLAICGGLSCREVVAVLYDVLLRDYPKITESHAEEFLRAIVEHYNCHREASNPAAPDWALPLP